MIRTMHDPLAKGSSILVLAGSDPAGVEPAFEVFAEKYLSDRGDAVLEAPLIDIEFTPVSHSTPRCSCSNAAISARHPAAACREHQETPREEAGMPAVKSASKTGSPETRAGIGSEPPAPTVVPQRPGSARWRRRSRHGGRACDSQRS